MSHPRILTVMAGARHGGAELFFERLTIALAKRDVPVAALIRGDSRRKELLETGGVPVFEGKFRGGIQRLIDRQTPRSFARALSAHNPDIVLSFMSRGARAVPNGKGRYLHVGRLGGYYDLKYFQSCDHLVGNTKDLHRYLLEAGWPADKAHYLPNFVREDRGGALRRQDLGLDDNTRVIVAFGRLHENKGFDVLIRAMEKVPGAVLLLAGTGPLETALKDQANALGGRVRFLGWRDDIPDLLALADVFCCPSRHEPLGNVVLEAWMQSKPVVAAAAQGPVELIVDGENGLLAPLEDSDVLAQKLEQVLMDSDLSGRLAIAGHDSYMREFCEDAVIDRYLAFFESILKRD